MATTTCPPRRNRPRPAERPRFPTVGVHSRPSRSSIRSTISLGGRCCLDREREASLPLLEDFGQSRERLLPTFQEGDHVRRASDSVRGWRANRHAVRLVAAGPRAMVRRQASSRSCVLARSGLFAGVPGVDPQAGDAVSGGTFYSSVVPGSDRLSCAGVSSAIESYITLL
jgi:hypothetical protein